MRSQGWGRCVWNIRVSTPGGGRWCRSCPPCPPDHCRHAASHEEVERGCEGPGESGSLWGPQIGGLEAAWQQAVALMRAPCQSFQGWQHARWR